MIDPHGERVREFYRKQGEARERERIIKLLEDNLAAAAPKPDIIALIKGEMK
jgi:hypothetical protein